MDELKLFTPQNCRARALVFAKRAATCASPKAHAIFTSIAGNLLALAHELEMRDRGHEQNVRTG
jgi:hypothetical protein